MIQAWAEGKTIQVRVKDHIPPLCPWNDVVHERDGSHFEDDIWEWRVKPEPKTHYIVLVDGRPWTVVDNLDAKIAAMQCAKTATNSSRITVEIATVQP